VDGTSLYVVGNNVNCEVMVGYKAVYRMCFAMTCFFFLFSIIMIRVRSSKDPRAAIQNGYDPPTYRDVLPCRSHIEGGSGAIYWRGHGLRMSIMHAHELLFFSKW